MGQNKQEKTEVSLLLDKGYQYRLRYQIPPKGIYKWLNAPTKTAVRILEFKQPTLAVLDLVTERYLALEITEPGKDAQTSAHIQSAVKTAADNAAAMAEIIAIFALGEDCFKFDGRHYEYDVKKVRDLAALVFHNVTPEEMKTIITATTALANLPDFLNSIRLTGASRTTMAANLVE